MRRNFISVLAVLVLTGILLTGCLPGRGHKDAMESEDDISQVVTVSVKCDYGNIRTGKATLVLSAPVELEAYDIKSKSDGKTIKNLIVGDILEVAYGKQDPEAIRQVSVDAAIVVKIEKAFVPGSGELDFYFDPSVLNATARHSHLNFIIDENGRLIDKSEAYSYEQLYAVYKVEDVDETISVNPVITLSAIYTCDPRTVCLSYVAEDSDP